MINEMIIITIIKDIQPGVMCTVHPEASFEFDSYDSNFMFNVLKS